jgi:hypothetical protein
MIPKSPNTDISISVSLLVVFLTSCAPDYAVRLHAQGDLNCPDEQIQVTGGPIDYLASGCGQSQQYRCATNDGNRYCWKQE